MMRYLKFFTIPMQSIGIVIAILILLVNMGRVSYALDESINLRQTRLDTWSVRDGLTARSINAINQTPDGFLWLATDVGLTRFDAGNFTLYNSHNTLGLTSDMITTMLVDRRGSIWIGTNWAGFGTFKDGRYQRSEPWNKTWTIVNTLCESSDGSIWAAGMGVGSLYHVVDGHVKTTANIVDNVTGIVPVGQGEVVTSRYDTGLTKITSQGVPTKFQPTRPIRAGRFFCALRTSDGAIWCGTEGNGLVRILQGQAKTYGLSDGLASMTINCLYQDRAGRLWIGTNNGICVWNGQSFSHFGKIDGLPDSSVHSIFEDREGNLWVGAGATLCRFAATKLMSFPLTLGTLSVGITGQYWGVSASKEDRVWCTTAGGLALLSPRGVVWLGSPFHRRFDGVAEGPDGLVWLTWFDKFGIQYVVAVPHDDLLHFVLKPEWGEAYSSTKINEENTALALARYHPIKIPTHINLVLVDRGLLTAFNSTTIYRMQPNKIVTQHAFKDIGWLFTAQRDGRGGFWLGTTTGLVHIKNSIPTITNEGLTSGAHVLGLEASDSDNLWIATDKGLARRRHGKTVMYGLESGLPSSELFEILSDGAGRLWIGCGTSIFSVNIADFDAYDRKVIHKIPVKIYQVSDGIHEYPTNFQVVKSQAGRLWFSAKSSVVMVDPHQIVFNMVPPPVCILDASVDHTTLSLTGTNMVAPGKGAFRVHFASLTFAAPEKVRFRYRLDGVDSGWSDVGDRRVATYPYLSPGKYRFSVISCNNDGVWNQTGATLAFELKPHFYQTLWFRVAMVLLALAFLGSLYALRTRQMRQHTVELERKVAERTWELRESHNALEASQCELEASVSDLMSANNRLWSTQEELEAQNSELLSTRAVLAEANGRLEALATTDGLTGLKNHRAFQDQLEIEWQRFERYGTPMSLIFLDVDKFKLYNDAYGHPGGDDVLRRVASLLFEHARESDVVARYGGEEFVVLAMETDLPGALHLAERLRGAIESASWPLRSVTASFGVATADLGTPNAASLIAAADAALYLSKETGRNRVTCAAETENVLRLA